MKPSSDSDSYNMNNSGGMKLWLLSLQVERELSESKAREVLAVEMFIANSMFASVFTANKVL